MPGKLRFYSELIDNMKSIPTVMALWKEGYFSDEDVVAWADAKILKSEGDLAEPLIELSLKGPSHCENLESYVFPEMRKLSFSEKFAVRLKSIDITSSESLMKFITWASCEAMGEDLRNPEVLFGYLLDEAFGYEEGNPLALFHREIEPLKQKAELVFQQIIKEIDI